MISQKYDLSLKTIESKNVCWTQWGREELVAEPTETLLVTADLLYCSICALRLGGGDKGLEERTRGF